MELQAVIFDLDGTLLDTLADLTDSVNATLAGFGFPTHTKQAVCAMVGNGIGLLIRRAVPENTPETVIEQVYRRFLPHYQQHCMDKTRPYPGICEVLLGLRERGLATAVVSNKADAAVKQLAAHYFPGLLTTALGELPPLPRKPAPDMCLAVLRTLNCPAGRAVYVGDSEVDVQTAKNAGLRCVSALWGFRSKAVLQGAGATEFAATPLVLPELL